MTDPLHVQCPACNAPPGDKCRIASEYIGTFGEIRRGSAVYLPRAPHIKRRELAAKREAA